MTVSTGRGHRVRLLPRCRQGQAPVARCPVPLSLLVPLPLPVSLQHPVPLPLSLPVPLSLSPFLSLSPCLSLPPSLPPCLPSLPLARTRTCTRSLPPPISLSLPPIFSLYTNLCMRALARKHTHSHTHTHTHTWRQAQDKQMPVLKLRQGNEGAAGAGGGSKPFAFIGPVLSLLCRQTRRCMLDQRIDARCSICIDARCSIYERVTLGCVLRRRWHACMYADSVEARACVYVRTQRLKTRQDTHAARDINAHQTDACLSD